MNPDSFANWLKRETKKDEERARKKKEEEIKAIQSLTNLSKK